MSHNIKAHLFKVLIYKTHYISNYTYQIMTKFNIEYVREQNGSEKTYINNTHITFNHKNKKVAIVINGKYNDDPYYNNNAYFSIMIDDKIVVGDADESLDNFIVSSKDYVEDDIFKKLKFIVGKVKIYPIIQFNVDIV